MSGQHFNQQRSSVARSGSGPSQRPNKKPGYGGPHRNRSQLEKFKWYVNGDRTISALSTSATPEALDGVLSRLNAINEMTAQQRMEGGYWTEVSKAARCEVDPARFGWDIKGVDETKQQGLWKSYLSDERYSEVPSLPIPPSEQAQGSTLPFVPETAPSTVQQGSIHNADSGTSAGPCSTGEKRGQRSDQ